jgi:hypothetical protein
MKTRKRISPVLARLATLGSAFALAVTAPLAVGCADTTCMDVANQSSAKLTGTESVAAGAQRFKVDGAPTAGGAGASLGRACYPDGQCNAGLECQANVCVALIESMMPESFSSASIATYLTDLPPGASSGRATHWSEPKCIMANIGGSGPEGIELTFMVSLDCPSKGPGSYRLEDLNATVCDNATCSALVGTLAVRAFALPCGEGACGRLDADIEVPVAAPGTGPSIRGSAELSYAETARSCGGGLVLGGA